MNKRLAVREVPGNSFLDYWEVEAFFDERINRIRITLSLVDDGGSDLAPQLFTLIFPPEDEAGWKAVNTILELPSPVDRVAERQNLERLSKPILDFRDIVSFDGDGFYFREVPGWEVIKEIQIDIDI